MDKIKITSLTPEIADNYLKFKLEEQNLDFIKYWREFVPCYFSEDKFCKMVNDLRNKIREYRDQDRILEQNALLEQSALDSEERTHDLDAKKNINKHIPKTESAFKRSLGEIVFTRINNNYIDSKKVVSLVGVLLHVFKDAKFQEYIVNQTKKEVGDLFALYQKNELLMSEQIESVYIVNKLKKTIGSSYEKFVLSFWDKTKKQDDMYLAEMEYIIKSLLEEYHIDDKTEENINTISDYLLRFKRIVLPKKG